MKPHGYFLGYKIEFSGGNFVCTELKLEHTSPTCLKQLIKNKLTKK